MAEYGGPYLHEVEREKAELRRAKIEGREPDLTNPGATAGDYAPDLTPVSATSQVDAEFENKNDELETDEPDDDPFKTEDENESE